MNLSFRVRIVLGRSGRAQVHRASGAPRSEIQEEPKAGDIRAGEYPMFSALALKKEDK
ncbi:hypothetical protein [Variovorax paradoxus]|uniref:hypothetical protein n=1 Tax=Variovorax paradoxus TaxID=34073 RepID=UPI0012BC2EA5|nr:hypothetical protein [Variovorax paradoxus]